MPKIRLGFLAPGLAIGGAVCLALAVPMSLFASRQAPQALPLSNGKLISPEGSQQNVGSLPVSLVLSPDGKFIVVSSMGDRSAISILDSKSGKLLSKLDLNETDPGGKRKGFYFGVAFGATESDGALTLYASRGSEHLVSVLKLDSAGIISQAKDPISLPGSVPGGLALSKTGEKLFVASATANPAQNLSSELSIVNLQTGKSEKTLVVPGYPYAVTAMSEQANPKEKIYVSSEQGGVAVLDPANPDLSKKIETGDHPLGLLLNKAQDKLFVANSGSDTISVVDTSKDTVEKTILLRPAEMRGLAGATPTGLALSPDEHWLYVTLADYNAVAVVDLSNGSTKGYIPVGWYPTGIAVSQDGKSLFVANAKGVISRTPNDRPVAFAAGEKRPQYIQNILEGTVSKIDIDATMPELDGLSRKTLANNRSAEIKEGDLSNLGVDHVIYIVKENRTYDQVLSDLPQGNGDASLLLFGRKITPNQHALAERFVLLDNFFCSGEVSGDGWNWSVAGMANPYVVRNVVYGYTGHDHPYDYEGTNNGVAADWKGIKDAGAPAGGYLWDGKMRDDFQIRNFGFFCDDPEKPRTEAENGSAGEQNFPTKMALAKVTDENFRGFDMDYSDSEAWMLHKLPGTKNQKTAFGNNKAPSRFSEWKREFDGFVKAKKMPNLQLIRFGNDHTEGTRANAPTPEAYVADNDFAVGQVVEAVSKSPFWSSTAIFVVEDDAQNGYDHVDAHRSIAFVVSPHIKSKTVDHRFFNTDSVLRTMTGLLGMKPMNHYVATAPIMDFIGKENVNRSSFKAILPERSIVGAVNSKSAYRSKDSARFFSALEADRGPVATMNEIVWRSVKGDKAELPGRKYASRLTK